MMDESVGAELWLPVGEFKILSDLYSYDDTKSFIPCSAISQLTQIGSRILVLAKMEMITKLMC